MQHLYKKYGLLAVLLWLAIPAQASAQSGWLNSQDPTLTNIRESIPADQVPYHGSPICSPNTSFVTIPKNILKAQQEVSFTACATSSNFGLHEPNGLIRLHGTNVAGPVKYSNGSTRSVFAIPNSDHVMFVAGGFYGSNRYIIRNFLQNIETKPQPNGTIVHQLKPGVEGVGIKDAAGTLIDFSGGTFSANGKWMIGDVHQVGMTRVNLETGETLVFGSPYNHANGVRPQFISAVSSDGRYAVATEDGYGIFTLYDLSTCTPNANQTKQATCQSRNLLPALQRLLPGFKEATYLSFSTNYTIRMHARHGNNINGYYTLSAAGKSESLLDYMALGDSFASGEGTFSYKPYTDIREPLNTCHLSPLSYPYLLAGRSLLNSIQSVACSGARMTNITSPNYSENEAQSKGKSHQSFDNEVFSNYLVGYRPQIAFVDKNKPRKVTVSISGNDIGFSSILLSCLAPGTCYETAQEKLNIAHTITSKYDELVTTYQAIKQQSSTSADVYALGYPLLAVPNGNCALNVQLNSQEIEFSNNIIMHLNSVISAAAKKSGVAYIDITEAFKKYRLCEGPSDTLAVNGLTLGNDKTFSLPITDTYTLEGYFSGRESFHPNQLGHRLLADAIVAATNNLRIVAPDPVGNTPTPSTYGTPGLTTAQSQNLLPRRISFNNIVSKSVVARASPHAFSLGKLAPGSDVTLYTTPQTFQPIIVKASIDGHSLGSITIPLPHTGLITLHASATNASGEPVDYQQIMYVAANYEDIDGDSTPNLHEPCLLVIPSFADTDKDTIDDACDPYIGKPPLRVASGPVTISDFSPIAETLHVTSSPATPLLITTPIKDSQGEVRSITTSTPMNTLNNASHVITQPHVAPSPHTSSPLIFGSFVAVTLVGIAFYAQKRWHNHH